MNVSQSRFSPAQRLLYDIVHRVQQTCINLCVPGASLDEIYQAMTMLLAQEIAQNDVLEKKVPDDEMLAVSWPEFGDVLYGWQAHRHFGRKPVTTIAL